jgi:hypothetical protein
MKLSKLLDEIKITAPERPPFMEGDVRNLGASGIDTYYLMYIINVKETPKRYKVVIKVVNFGPDGELLESEGGFTEYYRKGEEGNFDYKAKNEFLKQKFLREKRHMYSRYLDKFKDETINAPLLRSIISDITIPKEDYDSILKQAIEQIKKIQKHLHRKKKHPYICIR